ncbi:MAG: hypothetical protein RLZZ159_1052, partial [Actinomycetota bacterium]
MREGLKSALAGVMPDVGQPKTHNGELAETEKVLQSLELLKGRTIGAIGDAPAGFTPCTYDSQALLAK